MDVDKSPISTYQREYEAPRWKSKFLQRMSQSEVFRPSDGPLMVRGNLSDGLPNSADVFRKDRPGTQNSGYRFGRMSHNSFFTRHNPHPGRVRHIKGLLDIPICAVNDNGYFANPRYSMSFPPNSADNNKLRSYKSYIDRLPVNAINVNSQMHPINTITGLQYFMGKPLNFRVFREKAVPKMGIVPVTEAWRDELRALTEAIGVSNNNLPKINDGRPLKPTTGDGLRSRMGTGEGGRPRTTQYSANTGRLIPPPSRAMSRQNSRQGKRSGFMDQFEHIAAEPDIESMILQMLCQILQTDDVSAVQAWLVSANEREKTLVLDMIRAALSSNEDYYNRSVKKEYIEEQPRQGTYSNHNEENYEGQIIGDETAELGKTIDRLSLMGEDPIAPRPPSRDNDLLRDYNPKPLLDKPSSPVHPIPEADEDIVKPHMNDVFRTGMSRSSSHPRSVGRIRTPMSKAGSPDLRTEVKLRYSGAGDHNVPSC